MKNVQALDFRASDENVEKTSVLSVCKDQLWKRGIQGDFSFHRSGSERGEVFKFGKYPRVCHSEGATRSGLMPEKKIFPKSLIETTTTEESLLPGPARSSDPGRS